MSYPYKLSPEEQRLPQAERIVKDIILNGIKVEKQIYDDGSYGIRDDSHVIRYFPNGKLQTYRPIDGTFILKEESLPDGTFRNWHNNGQIEIEHSVFLKHRREWYENGSLSAEYFPDYTGIMYDKHGKIIYHETETIKDTVVYLAKERVEKKMNEQMNKYAKKVEEANNAVQKFARKLDQKIATKAVNSKAFNDIAMLKAKHEVKKSLGK